MRERIGGVESQLGDRADRVDHFDASRRAGEGDRPAQDFGMAEGDGPADLVNAWIAPGADDDLGADAGWIAEGDREERFLGGVGHMRGGRWRGSGFQKRLRVAGVCMQC